MPDTSTRNTRDGRRLVALMRTALARSTDKTPAAARRRAELTNLVRRIEAVLERDEQTQQENPV
jgi:hypothetical protein